MTNHKAFFKRGIQAERKKPFVERILRAFRVSEARNSAPHGLRYSLIVSAVIAIASMLFAGGCGLFAARETVELTDLIARLAAPDFISRLDAEHASFVSSSDPTGGNDDFNNYLRPGPTGWWVLADLKGPGYVSRFWFTGGRPDHGIKLFFDNEKTARIDTTLGKFFGGMDPFLPPLAMRENFCYFNHVPLTYRRRLIVMVEEGGTEPGNWPRLFYQINYTSLPRAQTVETFTLPPAPEVLQAVTKVAGVWSVCGPHHESTSASAETSEAVSILVGDAREWERYSDETILTPLSSWRMAALEGPAVMREIRITPDFDGLPAPEDRERALRDVLLRIYWNGHDEPSVLTPLGDFGGSFWRRTRYQSMFFGMHENTWSVRFPMPFAQSMELELENQGEFPFGVRVELAAEPKSAFDERHGYFHAVWRRSTPADIGRPHVVLETEGRGRFVGCLLSAVSFDKNFWLLEADERMWRDGEVLPFWDGTGLEDYFNGGWYYQNVMARPLHGLPMKNFFRTAQYRVHLPDVINFNSSFRMIFERGPEDRSRGTLESLAWYYLDAPRYVGVRMPPPAERQEPENEFAEPTIMIDLLNYERFYDYAGAFEFIDGFLAKYEDFPYATLLLLRQAAYVERMHGHEKARPLIERFLEEPPESPAHRQASMLLDFHDKSQKALLGFNANMPARVFLGGEVQLEAVGPERFVVEAVELKSGRNVLAIQARYQSYPSWVQLYLRKQNGSVFTTPEWKHAVNPAGAWWMPDYDDSEWSPVGGTGTKGPPEEPYIFLKPNAFIDMQSRAFGLRPSDDWPSQKGTVVYRHVFEVEE